MAIPFAAIAPAAIGAVGSVVGGAISSGANAREAARNRAFQERMRATQYQTAVSDMRAAGLNPALAYMQGGAGTPSGSTMEVGQLGEGVREGAGAALDVATAKQTLRILQAQENKVRAEGQSAWKDAAMREYDLVRMRHWLGNAGFDRPPDVDSPFGAQIRSLRAEARRSELSNVELQQMAEMWSRIGASGKFASFVLPFLRTFLGGMKPAPTYNFYRR